MAHTTTYGVFRLGPNWFYRHYGRDEKANGGPYKTKMEAITALLCQLGFPVETCAGE